MTIQPFLNQPPVRLCCSQRHWDAVCPDGRVMCQLCFERVTQDELWVDEHGDKWDVCVACKDYEDMSMEERSEFLRVNSATPW